MRHSNRRCGFFSSRIRKDFVYLDYEWITKKWFLSEKLVGLFLALGMGFILSLIVFTSEIIREVVGWDQEK